MSASDQYDVIIVFHSIEIGNIEPSFKKQTNVIDTNLYFVAEIDQQVSWT